jgi:hypothetical protein
MSWPRSGGSGAVMLLTQGDPLKRYDVGSRDGLTRDAATIQLRQLPQPCG